MRSSSFVEIYGGNGSAYFSGKIEHMETSLRHSLERANANEEWSKRIGNRDRTEGGFYPSHYSIPRIRMVWIMTENCARRFKGEKKATRLAASIPEA